MTFSTEKCALIKDSVIIPIKALYIQKSEKWGKQPKKSGEKNVHYLDI